MEETKINLVEKILDYAIKKEIIPTYGFFEKVLKLDVETLEKICNYNIEDENYAILFLIGQSPYFSDVSTKKIIEELSERNSKWLYYNVGMENKRTSQLIEENYGSEFFLKYIDIICEIEKLPISRIAIRNFQNMIVDLHLNNKQKLPVYILEEILEKIKTITIEVPEEDISQQLCEFYSQFTNKEIRLINTTIGFKEYHTLLNDMIVEREKDLKTPKNIYNSILSILKKLSEVEYQTISPGILKDFLRKILSPTLTQVQLQYLNKLFASFGFQELILIDNRRDDSSFSTGEIILKKLITEPVERINDLVDYMRHNSSKFYYLDPEKFEEKLELAKKYNYDKTASIFINLTMEKQDCSEIVERLMIKYQILDSYSQCFTNDLIEFILETTDTQEGKIEKIEKIISTIEQGVTKKQIDNISKNIIDETEYFESHDRQLTLNEWEMLFEYSKIYELKRIEEQPTVANSYSKYFDFLEQLKNNVSKDKVKKK